MMITYEEFDQVDICVGQIIDVEDLPEARKPAYKLTIDLLSEIGIKKSSAQLVANSTSDELHGEFELCVLNVAPRQT